MWIGEGIHGESGDAAEAVQNTWSWICKMLEKTLLKPGQELEHGQFGTVRYTKDCVLLEQLNGKPSTIYVEHEREVIEVLMSLVRIAPRRGKRRSGS